MTLRRAAFCGLHNTIKIVEKNPCENKYKKYLTNGSLCGIVLVPL